MKNQGFAWVEVMVVLAIIGVLVAFAAPSFMKARSQSELNTCVNNLRQIAVAKQKWGVENRKVESDAPSDMSELVGATLWIKATPVCPAGGTYTIGELSDECSCSIHGTIAAPAARQ